MNDGFGAVSLTKSMATGWAGHPICFYDTIDSTNLQAAKNARDGAVQGTLIVADCQTAGRGRRGRQWSSPAGANLYFSLILKPDYAPNQAPMVTLLMGLAVAEAIREHCHAEAYIKWPNDVVIDGKKVCGILTEMSLEGTKIAHVVVGVGINVGEQSFPEELAPAATSLAEQCGSVPDRTKLLVGILQSFEKIYDSFLAQGNLEGLMERYNVLLVSRDREVRVLDPKGEYRGIARGISETGELLVELGDGKVEKVYAGEVSVRGVYGYI